MASVGGCFLVISLLLGFALGDGEHLQNTLNIPPRVLLPYVASGSVHTNFSFKVLHGCFVWTSSRPEVVTVHPVYNSEDEVSGRKCSKEAILTTQARVPTRQMTEIFGEDEGNMFSTLDGLEFEWERKTVEGVGSVNAKSVLRFIQFEYSSYETSPEIYFLEAKGSHGGSIVIEPINTGTAIVKATLKDISFAVSCVHVRNL
ncbi:nuclear pore membrane glycoprotein 210-like [Stylophora pistillata]|uniref:nuclear pore membrane glycoprotein 210-like n=1 Tax=Stylophora pistillata TaxID=50429 RepID=UPI000C040176|nr:nuclear pore membrane glycoprotein 210-like [Stylophora pistillata]